MQLRLVEINISLLYSLRTIHEVSDIRLALEMSRVLANLGRDFSVTQMEFKNSNFNSPFIPPLQCISKRCLLNSFRTRAIFKAATQIFGGLTVLFRGAY